MAVMTLVIVSVIELILVSLPSGLGSWFIGFKYFGLGSFGLIPLLALAVFSVITDQYWARTVAAMLGLMNGLYGIIYCPTVFVLSIPWLMFLGSGAESFFFLLGSLGVLSIVMLVAAFHSFPTSLLGDVEGTKAELQPKQQPEKSVTFEAEPDESQ